MSFKAISWARDVNDLPSSAKFVLFIYATYADEHWEGWASNETIARETALDIKTVKNAVRELESRGHIARTRRRAGKTGSVIVWKIGPADFTEASVRITRVTTAKYEAKAPKDGPDSGQLRDEAGPELGQLAGSQSYPQAGPEAGPIAGPNLDHVLLKRESKNPPLPPLSPENGSGSKPEAEIRFSGGASGNGDAVWDEARLLIRKSIGEVPFKAWFERIGVIGVSGGVLELSAPTAFVAERLANEFGPLIERVGVKLYPAARVVRIKIRETA